MQGVCLIWGPLNTDFTVCVMDHNIIDNLLLATVLFVPSEIKPCIESKALFIK